MFVANLTLHLLQIDFKCFNLTNQSTSQSSFDHRIGLPQEKLTQSLGTKQNSLESTPLHTSMTMHGIKLTLVNLWLMHQDAPLRFKFFDMKDTALSRFKYSKMMVRRSSNNRILNCACVVLTMNTSVSEQLSHIHANLQRVDVCMALSSHEVRST
jgi:hypothetical protein